MHLQITGRLEPGETYAQIELDAANILPKGEFVTFELVNIIICKQEDHTHLEGEQKADYPVDPNRYAEVVTIKRPRPQPLTFRRRTTVHVPHLEPPQQRARRDAGDNDDNDDDNNENELGDMDLMYAAAFRESIYDFEIENFGELYLESLVNTVLQGKQGPACFGHFQRLLEHQPIYQLVDPANEEEKKKRKKRVQITLPPLTQLTCMDPSFFKYLGMENVASRIGETNMFGLVNPELKTSKIFISTEAHLTALKFSFYGDRAAPEKYDIFFQRLNPIISSKVSLRKFCNKNALATTKLFQMILNCIVEALNLPLDSLKAFLLEDETTLLLDKADHLLHAEDSADNFRISFKFGLRLQDLLGLEQSSVTWILSPRRASPGFKLGKALIPEDFALCPPILEETKIDLLNQESSHPTVQEWKKMWEKIQLQEAGRNLPPFDVGGEEVGFDIEGRPLREREEGAASDDEEFDFVQIPNPTPRPPSSFFVANIQRKHICTIPNIFPEYFTLILREGEPLDYLTPVRGLVSVLGLVRKLQPNIVSNACVVKNVQMLKSLSVEFVDESLNTIKAAPGSPAIWIKLDLKCRSGQQY